MCVSSQVLSLWCVALASASYTLGIRDSIMIAHSFKGTEFGPAQNVSQDSVFLTIKHLVAVTPA